MPPALALLAHDPNRAADHVLLAALPQLEPELQPPTLDIIIQRGHAGTLAGLVSGFAGYDEALQQQLLTRVNQLFTGIRLAATASTYESRAAAFDFIVHAEDGRNAYLLADALRSPCSRTRARAASCLNQLAAALRRRRTATVPESEIPGLQRQTENLVEALLNALAGWEVHLQPDALRAVLWLADWLEPQLRAKLDDPRTKLVHGLQNLLQRTHDPALAGFVLRALDLPQLRRVAADAISHARERDFADALIAESWLLADPEIKRRCRWVRDLPWLEERLEELLAGPPAQRVAVIRLLGASGISHERKLTLLKRALAEGDPSVMRAIAWEAVADEHEHVADLLGQLARQPDAITARVAARELERRDPEAHARRGAASPESAGQTSASSTAGTAPTPPGAHPDWSALWDRFELLNPEQQAAAAQQLRARAADWLVPLRARLAAGQADIRLRALRIAKVLGLIKELDEQTYRLAHDPDATVRSFALTLLTELPGATTLRILRDALRDPDERVQANAIAALDTLELGREAPSLEEKLDSPHNRVRANAVRALMRLEFAQAGATLLDMLEDDSNAHRISALWVVERLKLRALIGRLDRMAQSDPDPRVRTRAQRVLHGLLGEQPTSSSGRKPPAACATPLTGRLP